MSCRPDGRSRPRSSAAAGAGLLLAVLAAACSLSCGGGGGPAGPAASPIDSLLLITLDTLRADHVSSYGPSPVATPHLDALAAQGARVARAWSTVPLTTPAHASILTGLYPPSHGVRNNARFRLPDDVTTLAELLGARGRATAAFVSSFTTSRLFGLGQGFQHFDDDLGNDETGARRSQRPGPETATHAAGWLAANAKKPFFAWIHLFDPHTPYAPPSPFRERHPGDPYSGEVALTDHLVGELVAALERSGAAGRTAIVVLADHGEGLGTHGEEEHGLLLYEETLAVPFFVVAPGKVRPGTVIQDPSSVVDVVPTVLALLGEPPPRETEGRDLFAAAAPAAPGAGPAAPGGAPAPRALYAETLYPFEEFGWSALYALREGNDKYIESTRPELYDLAADPKEGSNRVAAEAGRAAAMQRTLRETAAGLVRHERLSAAAGFGGGTDPETIARLESLGYAAGGPGGANAGEEALPGLQGRNPRDAMDDYQLFDRAQELMRAGQPDAAIKLLTRLAGTDPDNPQVLLKLAQACERAGRDDEAERWYKAMIERHPTFYLGYRSYSTFLEGRDRPLDARALWLRLSGLLPGYVGIETRLASTELAAGQAPAAARRLDEYLALHPADAEGWALAGDARAAQGDAAGALAAYRKALEIRPTERGAVDGLVAELKKQGRPDEARKELDGLLERAPGDPVLVRARRQL
jgi:arylsulfatase A-like enzyme/Flp pilus assembly protein TadD